MQRLARIVVTAAVAGGLLLPAAPATAAKDWPCPKGWSHVETPPDSEYAEHDKNGNGFACMGKDLNGKGNTGEHHNVVDDHSHG